MTLEEVKAILAALVREHVEFVIIGSMAMAAQGLPRATHDLDLFVQVANPKMLYRMKKDTVRPQDRADAARIREAFGLGDE